MELLSRYRTRAVILDTNLMILLIVGLHDRRRIATFKRTHKYTADDFDLLVRILSRFPRWIVTPNILTEADNLTRQLGAYGATAEIIRRLLEDVVEVYVPARSAVEHARFPDLGLADCATIACLGEALLITDDFRLYSIVSRLGHDAVNINHLRSL